MLRRFRRARTIRNAAGSVAALALVAALAGACGGGDAPRLEIERPGQFGLYLPAGWKITLPESEPADSREPGAPAVTPLVTAASASQGKTLLAVFPLTSGKTVEEAASVWSESIQGDLGPFDVRKSGKQEIAASHGNSTGKVTGERMELLAAVVGAMPASGQKWALLCTAPKLDDSDCQQILDDFELRPR